MKLFISTGNSRMEKKWNGMEMELEDFRERISHTIRTAETVEQYRKLSKAKQDDIKDVGGFVLGKLKGGRRKKDCVVFRSALTLDMDYATEDIPEQMELFFDFRCFIYSTHKHTPEKPRLRLIIPLSRNLSPDEYVAVARKVAEDIGIRRARAEPAGRRLHPYLVRADLVSGTVPADEREAVAAGAEGDGGDPSSGYKRHTG